MSPYIVRQQRRKRYRPAEGQLDLFNGHASSPAIVDAPPPITIVRRIAIGCGVSLSIARVIAEHAGFNLEAAND
jgi:hypothetical protein